MLHSHPCPIAYLTNLGNSNQRGLWEPPDLHWIMVVHILLYIWPSYAASVRIIGITKAQYWQLELWTQITIFNLSVNILGQGNGSTQLTNWCWYWYKISCMLPLVLLFFDDILLCGHKYFYAWLCVGGHMLLCYYGSFLGGRGSSPLESRVKKWSQISTNIVAGDSHLHKTKTQQSTKHGPIHIMHIYLCENKFNWVVWW